LAELSTSGLRAKSGILQILFKGGKKAQISLGVEIGWKAKKIVFLSDVVSKFLKALK